MTRGGVYRDRATAAIFDAGANRPAQERSPQEGEQRRNETAQHDRSTHHPETDR